jgi:clan AA aspartic protease
MIEGIVTADGDAVIPLKVRGFAGQEVEVQAIVDTGFGGALSLHPDHVPHLGLLPSGEATVTLADGTEYVAVTYSAIVEWDGVERLVTVTASDAAILVGMALFRGFNLSVDVVDGGAVRISRLP